MAVGMKASLLNLSAENGLIYRGIKHVSGFLTIW